jgi:hypothetical protein
MHGGDALMGRHPIRGERRETKLGGDGGGAIVDDARARDRSKRKESKKKKKKAKK